MAGTSQIFSGGFGAHRIFWQVGSDCARDDGIHTRWRRVMLWISGESRALNWTVVFIRLVALDLAASFHSLQDPQRQLRPNEGASAVHFMC